MLEHDQRLAELEQAVEEYIVAHYDNFCGKVDGRIKMTRAFTKLTMLVPASLPMFEGLDPTNGRGLERLVHGRGKEPLSFSGDSPKPQHVPLKPSKKPPVVRQRLGFF